ncbi:MAG: bacillithiol biosynthesis cysteine-adding enzyme BshC, partial [Bacteroidota bacterium]
TLKDLQPLLKEIPGDITMFREAYSTSSTLAEAVRHYVNALFSHEGIVVIDGDDAQLKQTFSHVMEEDILSGTTRGLVEHTNGQLESLGYEPQVFVRDVNFFWLCDGSRERIENTGETWSVLTGGPALSDEQLRSAIRETPERLSPNVILRPLYQETILPNLAYVGGPAENVYWLQLKSVFRHFNVPFPMLMPRNFVMVMDGPTARLFGKTGLNAAELFLPKSDLLNLVTIRCSEHTLNLESEKAASASTFEHIRKLAGAIDPTLDKMVEAEQHRRLKGLEIIEKKMLRAERRRQSDRLRQVETLKDNLFPGGGLQERTDNLLLFSQTDPEFVNKILTALDPFEYAFNLLSV